MGFSTFFSISTLLFLALLFRSTDAGRTLGEKQYQPVPNTDEYFVYDFFQKMGHVYDVFRPVCEWGIVTCDASYVNVIGLNGASLGLVGSIPDNTIGKLTKIQSLDLSGNQITSLPNDFWSLNSLKRLNMSNNRISMSLPSNVGNFGLLEMLDFSGNEFFGRVPDSISSLNSLEVVSLKGNRFESTVPSGIVGCRSLSFVDFSLNKFNGVLPNGFEQLTKLKSLNLAGNEIEGKGSDFAKMGSLTYLNVSRNLFQGSVVEIFHELLEVVDLSGNRFEGHVSQVEFGSSLVYLDLSDNDISGESFGDLSQARSLKHLNFAKNRFLEQSLMKIDSLGSLEYLNLSNTNLVGQIGDEIALLTHLKTIDLSANNLIGKIPLLSLQELQTLDLSFNNLTGEIPMVLLKKLPWMERFNFSYNNLTLCNSAFSPETLQSAFSGSTNSCPIAVNPTSPKEKTRRHKGLELALVLTVSIMFLLGVLLFCAFGCRKKTTMWGVKQDSYDEEQGISGPFSFQTDSTTWVADVKVATLVPVVIFEKPLLKLTFSDLLSATSNFDRGTLLAEGRFGPVYRGFLAGEIHVAVKVLVHGSTMTDQEAASELEYLGRIKHPNLVRLKGYCLAGEQRIAIYDYMENGNLHNLLHDLPLGVQTPEDWTSDTWEVDVSNGNGIQTVGSEGLLTTWRFRHKIALGTARALANLHHGCSPPIIHRDMKASSVYLDESLEPRLSDFGLSKIFGNDVADELTRGSPGYIPPEFQNQEGNSSPYVITPKSDVYGFGVILFELITGKKPVEDEYPDDNSSKDLNLVSWVRGLVKKNQGSRTIDPKIRGTGAEAQMVEALKIGYLCTADLPAKRPSMQQVVGLLKDLEQL